MSVRRVVEGALAMTCRDELVGPVTPNDGGKDLPQRTIQRWSSLPSKHDREVLPQQKNESTSSLQRNPDLAVLPQQTNESPSLLQRNDDDRSPQREVESPTSSQVPLLTPASPISKERAFHGN